MPGALDHQPVHQEITVWQVDTMSEVKKAGDAFDAADRGVADAEAQKSQAEQDELQAAVEYERAREGVRLAEERAQVRESP